MRNRILITLAFLSFLTFTGGSKQSGLLYRGERGEIVRVLQQWLADAGFPAAGDPDGYFGQGTEAAVRAFQQDAGLAVDGVVGPATWAALGQAALYGGRKTLTSRELLSPLLSWETIDKFWPRGNTAWLTDPKSRTTIGIIRTGGHWHADVEPLTAEDTAILKGWYGGSWSWARRPAIFRFERLQCGASINGMPHGADTIKNGFPGHFCLHFLGSRIHRSGRMDAEHQRMVMRAAEYLLGAALPEEKREEEIR
ncbi:MAG: peptidoglycan-binding protein [Firmicutes bacterium]|nr:peptidoglycan-binding protein [Bacillota bacterium]